MTDWSIEPHDFDPEPLGCHFAATGDNCGRTTCAECGGEAAAQLVRDGVLSFTGLVVAIRRLRAEGDTDPHDVWVRIRIHKINAAYVGVRRTEFGQFTFATRVIEWLNGVHDAVVGDSPLHRDPTVVAPETFACYWLGRVAFVCWTIDQRLARLRAREQVRHALVEAGAL